MAEVWDLHEFNLDNYLNLGFDGEGSPIGISLIDSCVYLLDHEFEFDPTYMNRSIQDLLIFIKKYQTHIDRINLENGPDSFFELNYPVGYIDELFEELSKIDKSAVSDNSFWGMTLEGDRLDINTNRT